MKSIAVILFLILFTVSGYGTENDQPSNAICEEYGWSEVVSLVEPYLSGMLHTALVMQGQSSEYDVSAAASQAMDDSMPDKVKSILQQVMAAGC